jgi:hypothetical protein
MSNHSTGHKTDFKTDPAKTTSDYRSAAATPLPTKRAEPAKGNPEGAPTKPNEHLKNSGYSPKH